MLLQGRTTQHKRNAHVSMKATVARSCPALCCHTDYTVHGILQANILLWGAFPFSGGSSQPRDRTQVSHISGGFFTSWATSVYIQYHKWCTTQFIHLKYRNECFLMYSQLWNHHCSQFQNILITSKRNHVPVRGFRSSLPCKHSALSNL